jgi:hypothetical protein
MTRLRAVHHARDNMEEKIQAYEPAQTVVTVVVREARYAAAATLAVDRPSTSVDNS